VPLRTAQAWLAVLPDYAERDRLGTLQADLSASFNEERLDVLRAGETLEAEITGDPDPVGRSAEEKGISLQDLERALADAGDRARPAYEGMRARWFERLLGPDREEQPTSFHFAYMRRLSPLEATYTKERAVEICLDTLTKLGFDLGAEKNIRLDLDDRPQKSPRACVIPSDPPTVVHLITRAQGGLHDYQAFLHEAGHALHYAGVDPQLPYTFRNLARDHALTEIYSYILEAISREPGWHAEYFGLSDEQAAENAEATTFLEAALYRRYTAKLQFELDFWGRFGDDGGSSDGYAERLSAATGVRYRSDQYLSDMDAGFYSADYLRAWPLRRGHAPVERGDRRTHRLRAARHAAADRRARRLTRAGGVLDAQAARGLVADLADRGDAVLALVVPEARFGHEPVVRPVEPPAELVVVVLEDEEEVRGPGRGHGSIIQGPGDPVRQ
jgi:hypothetical protein